MRLRWFLLSASLVAACSAPTPTEDAGQTADAGLGTDADSGTPDAGATDAGTTDAGASDAGNITDAGLPDAGTPITVTFQEGVAGYAGSRSIGISTYGGLGSPGQYNANGMTFGDGQNDWCMGTGLPGSPAYDEVWLVRFENLNLPATARVLSATLTLTAYHYSSASVAIDGSYLAQPFDANTTCAGCTNANTGWRYRNGSSVLWAALGASGSGTDVVAGKSFRLPDTGSMPSNMRTSITGTLDPSIVQSWITGPNYGLRIVGGVSGVHVGFVQPQRSGGSVSEKPKLTITYVP